MRRILKIKRRHDPDVKERIQGEFMGAVLSLTGIRRPTRKTAISFGSTGTKECSYGGYFLLVLRAE